MTLEDKNQNDIINSELINSYNNRYVFSDKPINRLKTKPKIENKSILLDILKSEIENIKNCELKASANKLVFNDGDNQSKIMIVGEGPGQKEDEIGKPFVGDAGSLLNKMLKAINIERNKVYITNVVNYRPPNNRKPETAEISRYSHFLREHISIIKPKILLLFGNVASKSLLKLEYGITKNHGKWFNYQSSFSKQKILTMCIFHPSYLLRSPKMKGVAWEDLKKVKGKIKDLKILL